MINNNFWLCGMIRGNRAQLEKSISEILPYFFGCIFVVDDRVSKEDLDWLNSIKKGGEIIVKKWVNDHAHTSNEVLLCDKMQWGDYFLWIDETDEVLEDYIKTINTKELHDKNIGMIYLDHPFILRFHDGLRVASSPHWFFQNIIGETVNLQARPNYKKDDYLINHRDTLKSGFISPSKYWYCYPAFSNHTQLLYYQFSPEIWQYHENVRIDFRIYCKEKLGLDYTLESLEKYMLDFLGKYDYYFERVLELEVSLKDFFRLKVLKQNWQDLAKNRFNFSYFKWKNEGILDQGKEDGYIGAFNQYRLQKGLGME